MVEVVVFDVGETLIDETRIWLRWADRLGVPRDHARADRRDGRVGQAARRGVPARQARLRARGRERRVAREDPDGLRVNFDADDLYPDVRPGLAALRAAGYELIIAGNQPAQADDALTAMGLPVGVDPHLGRVGRGQAGPGLLRQGGRGRGRAARRHPVRRGPARQRRTARPTAGMRTALMRRGPWGYLHAARPEAAEADMVLDGLSGLVAALGPDAARPGGGR